MEELQLRQKRCVVRQAYRSKGYETMKLLLSSPFSGPEDVALKLHIIYFLNCYLFLLNLSLATESSPAASSSSELKQSLPTSHTAVQSSGTTALSVSLHVPQLYGKFPCKTVNDALTSVFLQEIQQL